MTVEESLGIEGLWIWPIFLPRYITHVRRGIIGNFRYIGSKTDGTLIFLGHHSLVNWFFSPAFNQCFYNKEGWFSGVEFAVFGWFRIWICQFYYIHWHYNDIHSHWRTKAHCLEVLFCPWLPAWNFHELGKNKVGGDLVSRSSWKTLGHLQACQLVGRLLLWFFASVELQTPTSL